MTASPGIRLGALSVTFGRAIRALDRVTLEVGEGETVGIVGESGSGKSTLCRTLVGLTRPTAGEVEVLGEPVTVALRRDPRGYRRRIQMLMQDAVATLSPRMTIGRLLAEAVAIHGLDRDETEERIRSFLGRLRLPPSILGRYPHEISGGQARRIGVIRALLLRPRVLVADEPTAGLDVSVQGELLNLLMEFQRELDLTFMIVSHNLHVIKRVTRRTLVMYLGQIVEDAPTRDLFARPAHPYATALISTNPLLAAEDGGGAIILRGEIPSNAALPPGCRFHTRCPVARPVCAETMPELEPTAAGGQVRCHFPGTLARPGTGAA
ncbi:MAG: ABC transporter ATP-binding protein [Rhodobacteraceae bacterium]|nr:ABC transporter ATP-binding protein [Paracoccaceae bacterium]